MSNGNSFTIPKPTEACAPPVLDVVRMPRLRSGMWRGIAALSIAIVAVGLVLAAITPYVYYNS